MPQPTMNRSVHLAARPHGIPVPTDFAIVDSALPSLADGEVLVRNLALSVDPYMRGRMNDAPSYVPCFALDEAMDGGAVGEVISSQSPDLAAGDVVLHNLGWREYATTSASTCRRVDVDAAPPSAYLGVLGMPGLTAYAGLLEVAAMQPGDAVFVSGAAGAVGSLVGQIAKLRGASRVVGSAGSAAKVAYLRDLGFDGAFDYHDGPVSARLAEAAPEGIDVYFDNVGGEHLEAAIGALRPHGRVALCGAISAYNATERPAGPRNLWLAIGKRLTLRGFIVSDHAQLRPAFLEEMSGWLRDGTLRWEQTTAYGLDQAADAFIGLLEGRNTGKMIVELAQRGDPHG